MVEASEEEAEVMLLQLVKVEAIAEIRMVLLDEVASTTHEDEVVVRGPRIPRQQEKTLNIKLELVAPEGSEPEEHVVAEVGLEVAQEVAPEATAMSQEVEEEDEAEVVAETTRNRKKLSINQTQRTAMVKLAASKRP